jgi:5'-nucleotidase / UDP-sugar diphosphatase
MSLSIPALQCAFVRLRQRALRPALLSASLCFGLPAAFAFPACPTPAPATQTISFVHVADLHGRHGASWGHKSARLYRYYKDVLSTNPYTVFTNGGDDYEKGWVAEQLSNGAASREAIVALGFDVRVLGNHDYAWGEQELLNFSQGIVPVPDPNVKKALVLASNTVYTGTNGTGFGAGDYGELQVGCVKIGFIGMVSKPWNEFDTQYTGDFLPNFTMRWDWVARAKQLIAAHRSNVDLLVLVSHMGFGTDQSVVNNTPLNGSTTVSAIDLALGGHNHGGFQYTVVKNTPVIQPEFYADGASRFDITWDVRNRKVLSRSAAPQNIFTSTLTATDTALQTKLQAIADKYAPEANKQLAVLELGRDYVQLAALAGRAGMFDYQADAALLDPALTWQPSFPAGGVTQQMFNDLYRVERQRANTPGFNSLYQATVTGAQLTSMRTSQPGWVYVGPAAPVAATSYKVLLHKGPALNPLSFFTSTLSNVVFKAETWKALDQYARARTAGCVYLDTDTTLPSCLPDTLSTIWNFDDTTQPFKTDRGVATMGYRDTAGSGWGPVRTQFGLTSAAGLPNLPDGASGVMAFAKTAPAEGYTITHNFPASGAFKSQGLVSNYTLVMDVLWPQTSDGVWRALMQTAPANGDDADWFVKNAFGGGIGISQYFGSLQPGVWNRIAMVVDAQTTGGSLQFFINGTKVGTINSAGQRHALAPQVLMFADNNSETAAGFVNALMLSARSWTATEVAALGGPSKTLAVPSTATLQATAGVSRLVIQAPAVTRVDNGLDFDRRPHANTD